MKKKQVEKHIDTPYNKGAIKNETYKETAQKPLTVIIKNSGLMLFSVILLLLVFLRFYQLDRLSPFGWDQVNNAWAAQDIIINQEFPLLGFQAKLNSGVYIGPLYYYLIAITYYFTDLDPIASGITAGITSIFTFLVLFFVTKRMFSFSVALLAVYINTVAYVGILFDRVQGPINFIPSTSLVIFYSLYQVLLGKPKYLLLLGITLGFSFHVHLTSIYYPIIILLTLPFFPRTWQMFKYALLSVGIFLLFLIPSAIAFLQNMSHLSSGVTYTQSSYHGFHGRRVLQLVSDAFIQFEHILTFPQLKPLGFIMLPLFFGIYLYRSMTRERLLFCYLIILWFLVPWFIMSTYSGEISDYYFSTNRFVGIVIIAYIFARLFASKNWLLRIALISILVYYGYFNIHKFFTANVVGLAPLRQSAFTAANEGRRIEWVEGSPESYLYYYYMYKKGKYVY